jgi:hypothetical protein
LLEVQEFTNVEVVDRPLHSKIDEFHMEYFLRNLEQISRDRFNEVDAGKCHLLLQARMKCSLTQQQGMNLDIMLDSNQSVIL